ncbi:MAG: hypothetical protein PHQ12_12475 [Chthoniobacteraceae bacterium]|nr:hypothetical protein [Chthoniobacteraceae bacterium]
MLSRRAILILFLLLPFTVHAAESASSHKKKTRRRHSTAQTSEAAKLEPVAAKRSSRAAKSSRGTENMEEKTSASSKLATRAVDAIPDATQPSSLYDRRTATATAPATGLFGLFGPKADGVRYDSRMIHAAQIAEARARQHSVRSCWRYVKEALLAANVVDTYPQTALAKQAGDELINRHGFRRLSISDPFKAPVGSVIVYGGPGAGHVEIRTADGFVSDFESPTPSKRPLLGIFVKPS